MDWREAARRLAKEIDFSRIPESVREALDSEARLYLANSGGADSVCATLLCWAYLENRDKPPALTCLHLNHALRGGEADRDEQFARELCGSLGVQFLSETARWSKHMSEVTEADARAARLSFFERAAEESGERRISIATGHHLGDVTESMLMRLSRGSGLQGLCAPREISQASKRVRFLRPLLGLSRDEIRGALTRCSIPWREDESNRGEAFYRNRLRKHVVPVWEQVADRPIGPGIERSRKLLEEDWRALEGLADQAWSEIWDEPGECLNRVELAKLPPGLQRRMLQRLAARAGAEDGFSASIAEALLQAVRKGASLRLDLSPEVRIAMGLDTVSCEPNAPVGKSLGWGESPLPVGCCVYLPDGRSIKSELLAVDEALWTEVSQRGNDDARCVIISAKEKQMPRLSVRSRRPGDAFKPHGKSSQKKLKSLLIDRKIKLEERDRLPVVTTRAGEILWVPGLPPGAAWLLEQHGDTALRLTYAR